MAVADIAAKNLEATKEQTKAIESLKSEVVMSKNISKEAFDSIKGTKKYQQSDIVAKTAMLHEQKNNVLMMKRSDAREELNKKIDEKVEIDKKIRDEKQLEAFEDASTIGKLTMQGTESSSLFLKRLVGLETTKQREDREARREAARNKDRGTMGSLMLGKQKDKKGGLFGLLGGMGKMLGGGLMKVIGPLFKVLKLVFKVLKFTALGAALIAGGIFFSMSASDQQKTIDAVMGFFKKVGEVLSSLGKAFGGAFMKNMDDMTDDEGNPIEGLVSKFGKFKEAWGAVLKKLSGISMKVGGKTYKGLEGFATMMGDLFGKIAGWFLDLGTGIATLITDPRKIMTKMSVAISNFFGGMMDTIGRFIDEFTSMEFLLQFMPDWLRETDMAKGWIKDASESRAKEALKEMDNLAKREKVLKDRGVSVQKTYDEQKAKVDAIDEQLNNDKIKLSDKKRKELETEKEAADQKRLNAYDMILEAKAERDRNKDRFEYAKESFEKSSEITIKNRAKEIAAKKSGVDVVKMDNQLAELNEERKKLMNEKLNQAGFNIGEFDLAEAEQIQKMLGGKTRIEKGDINEDLIQKLNTDFGIKEGDINVRQMNSFLVELKETQNKLAKNQAATAKIETDAKSKVDKFLPAALEQAKAENLKAQGISIPVLTPVKTGHTGGIISESGIIGAQKGEIIIDDVLVNTFKTAAEVMSGMNLMNLQRQTNTGAMQGGAPIIISNAPTTQINQNQAMVLPPSPIQPGNSDGPRLLN